MSKWFRWYEGTCEDGKFRLVASNAGVTVATVMGIWAALLEDAAHPEHRGKCLRGAAFYCAVLDVSDEDMEAVLFSMGGTQLLSREGDDIAITSWDKRQYETDAKDGTNADRQQRWREKRKQNENKTDRNGAVTAAKRPDTDTDTDTEKKEHCPVRKRTRTKETYSEDFEINFWKPYPRSATMSKKEAWREWMKLAPEKREAACRAIPGYQRHLQKNPTLQTVHACRFLSQERAETILEMAADNRPQRVEGWV